MEKKIRAESLPEPFGNAFDAWAWHEGWSFFRCCPCFFKAEFVSPVPQDSVEAEIMRELRELPFSLE